MKSKNLGEKIHNRIEPIINNLKKKYNDITDNFEQQNIDHYDELRSTLSKEGVLKDKELLKLILEDFHNKTMTVTKLSIEKIEKAISEATESIFNIRKKFITAFKAKISTYNSWNINNNQESYDIISKINKIFTSYFGKLEELTSGYIPEIQDKHYFFTYDTLAKFNLDKDINNFPIDYRAMVAERKIRFKENHKSSL